jgi:Rod binding domain-containing protein
MSDSNFTTSALDFGHIAQMRADSKMADEAVTKEAAQQFESIFINMMLKSMRQATERSGLFDSQASKTYESMFDQQIAVELSKGGMFGVADVLNTQMLAQKIGQPEKPEVRALKEETKPFVLKTDKPIYEIQRPRDNTGFALPGNRGKL